MAGPDSLSSGEMEHRHQRQSSNGSPDFTTSMGSSIRTKSHTLQAGLRAKFGLTGLGRRTLGIFFLLVTVFLWTLSNFLASSLFSDNTYDKPFFVVYVNSSVFVISLIPQFLVYLRRAGRQGLRNDVTRLRSEFRHHGAKVKTIREEEDETAAERLLAEGDEALELSSRENEKLSFRETLIISLEFSMLWFLANYFVSACFEYTSVASGTILSATSSVWTLIFCSMCHIEPFSIRKLIGVLASLVGVILVSSVDLTGQSDENRGSFPHKTPAQIAIGDAMAFISAIIYGIYVTVMKHRVGDENKVDMRLFFGLVGLWNMVLLWPIFFILHWTGLEPFELPSSAWIWTIIFANSISSFISDLSWAMAMLLTTPLVVTVGISLTIPLSLVGEMFRFGRYSSFLYWVGAFVVLISFVFINHESHDAIDDQRQDERREEATADEVA